MFHAYKLIPYLLFLSFGVCLANPSDKYNNLSYDFSLKEICYDPNVKNIKINADLSIKNNGPENASIPYYIDKKTKIIGNPIIWVDYYSDSYPNSHWASPAGTFINRRHDELLVNKTIKYVVKVSLATGWSGVIRYKKLPNGEMVGTGSSGEFNTTEDLMSGVVHINMPSINFNTKKDEIITINIWKMSNCI
jgi:hypothetical protein